MSKKDIKKKSRARYQCPTKLAELIDLINLVPINIQMFPSNFITKDLELSNESYDRLVLLRFRKLLETLPIDFQKHFNNLQTAILLSITNPSSILIKESPRGEVSERVHNFSIFALRQLFLAEKNFPLAELEILCTSVFLSMYDDYYSLRKDVLQFAQVRNYQRKKELESMHIQEQKIKRETELKAGHDNWIPTINERYETGIYPSLDLEPPTMQLEISVPILRDEYGNDYLGGFAQLIGKFDSDRLRICEICSKLFWAKRMESETCSPRCFNNLRQRLYRTLSDEEKEDRRYRRKAIRKMEDLRKNIRRQRGL